MPHYNGLQMGRAWYTSHVGQPSPSFHDVEVGDIGEPLPQTGGAKYHMWHEVASELLNPQAKEREEQRHLPPLFHITEEPDVVVSPAPSGRPPLRENERSLFLPEPNFTLFPHNLVIKPPRWARLAPFAPFAPQPTTAHPGGSKKAQTLRRVRARVSTIGSVGLNANSCPFAEELTKY